MPAIHSRPAGPDGGAAGRWPFGDGGAGARRLRSVLVVVEVALAVILVVGAGLFSASFVKLLRVDPGFDYRGVLALGVGVRIEPANSSRKRGQGGALRRADDGGGARGARRRGGWRRVGRAAAHRGSRDAPESCSRAGRR